MANPPTSRAIRNPKTRFNWRVSDFIRGVMVRWFVLRARITGRSYYCSTLAGQEDYNITVNSDLTVSCTARITTAAGTSATCGKTPLRKYFSARSRSNSATNWPKGKFRFRPVCVAPFQTPAQKHRAAQTAIAVSRDAAGKHRDVQRGLHRLRARRRGEYPLEQTDAPGGLRAGWPTWCISSKWRSCFT